MAQADIAISARGLARRFDHVVAVDGLDLEIPAGTVFGFLGPNGAGKTTTIRLLLGLVEPTGGTAEILGYDVRTHGGEVRRRSGVLLEHSGLYERLSAADNLDYYGRLWRMPPGARQARIVELLDHFGLADRRTEIVGTWSRGMKQKVALARALLHRPPVVFLDEPTAGLDPVASVALRTDLLALARREGVTVFVTTHNLDEAERMCDRVGVIRSGRLVAEGSPASLRALGGRSTLTVAGSGFDGALPALRARTDVAAASVRDGRLDIELVGDPPAAPIVRLLVERGAEVEEVRKGAASLEEAFLTLLGQPEAEVPLDR